MRRTHIALVALALVVVACSGDSGASTTTSTTSTLPPTTTTNPPPSTMVVEPEPVTDVIEVWAPAALIGALGDASAAYEIETGIDVQVVATDIEDILDRILDDPDGGPDVFVGPHVWLTALTRAGVAEPLTIPGEVVAGATEAVSLRGNWYAVPFGLDAIAQFRNPSALPTAPDTVESLTSGCGGTACLLLPEDSVEGHWPFLAGLGGYLFGPDEFAGWDVDDVGVDSDLAFAAGSLLDSIVNGGGILGDGDSTVIDRFVDGDAPLLWGDLTVLAALQTAGADFTVEALPTIGAQPSPVPLEITALWVNAFSPDKDAAIDLVERHLSQVDNARVMAIGLGLAPVDSDYSEDPDLAPFTRAGRDGDPVPTIEATTLAWEELAAAFTAIREGQDSEAAFDAAASNIRAES